MKAVVVAAFDPKKHVNSLVCAKPVPLTVTSVPPDCFPYFGCKSQRLIGATGVNDKTSSEYSRALFDTVTATGPEIPKGGDVQAM